MQKLLAGADCVVVKLAQEDYVIAVIHVLQAAAVATGCVAYHPLNDLDDDGTKAAANIANLGDDSTLPDIARSKILDILSSQHQQLPKLLLLA